MEGFVVRGPWGLWFAGRDPDRGVDLYTGQVSRACTFASQDSAWETAVALSDRNNGAPFMVYGIFRPSRRRMGGFR